MTNDSKKIQAADEAALSEEQKEALYGESPTLNDASTETMEHVIGGAGHICTHTTQGEVSSEMLAATEGASAASLGLPCQVCFPFHQHKLNPQQVPIGSTDTLSEE